MKKVIAILGLAAVVLTFASAAGATNNKKVTICHGTSSQSNPYVKNTVSISAIDGQGSNDHSHHIKDIIPPVKGVTDGQNWGAEGQAIYNNGCKRSIKQTTTTTGAKTTATTGGIPTTAADKPTATVGGDSPPSIDTPSVIVAVPAAPVAAHPAFTG